MSFLHDMYQARGRVIPARTSAYIIGDKPPYVSPIERRVVDGRADHKEHMRRNDVVEAGDMKLGEVANTERSPMSAVAPDIKRAIQELSR